MLYPYKHRAHDSSHMIQVSLPYHGLNRFVAWPSLHRFDGLQPNNTHVMVRSDRCQPCHGAFRQMPAMSCCVQTDAEVCCNACRVGFRHMAATSILIAIHVMASTGLMVCNATPPMPWMRDSVQTQAGEVYRRVNHTTSPNESRPELN